MGHREHILDLLKKKALEPPKKIRKPRATMSYKTQGNFRVGYTGHVEDIYKSNPN